MEYGDKHILVLGAGASGIGASWVLAQVGAHVVLNDYKPVMLPTTEEGRFSFCWGRNYYRSSR